MNPLWTIVGMALGVYGLRIAGFALANLPLSVTLERTLHFVPLAMLTALCVTTLPGHSAESPIRLSAAGGAALITWLTKRTWACIVSGMVFYWLFDWAFTQH